MAGKAVPEGMADQLQAVTTFLFAEDPPQKADILFIPGCSYPQPAELAARLWREGYAPYVLPSGRYSIKGEGFPGARIRRERYPGPYETEWAFFCDVLVKNGVPPEAVLREDQASFTKENAFLSRKRTDREGLAVRSALICCQPYHARRCLLYYQLAFPEAELRACPAPVNNIGRDTWFCTRAGIDKVMGELARCGSQFPELWAEALLPPDQRY